MEIRFERNPEHGCNEQDSGEEDEAEAEAEAEFCSESTALNPRPDSYPPSKILSLRTDYDLEEANSPLDFFSAPPPLHPPREVILDLLDPYLYVKAGGASLLDQNHVEWVESLTHPRSPPLIAGHVFPVVVQCDADVVGKPACAPQYIIYLRGPVAEAVSSIPSLYQHDSARGRTQINVTVTQAGVYDLWILPEAVRGDPNHPSCPDENRHWYVQGSGQTTLQVLPSVDSTVLDEMKECDAADYEGPVPGRWRITSMRRTGARGKHSTWRRRSKRSLRYGTSLMLATRSCAPPSAVISTLLFTTDHSVAAVRPTTPRARGTQRKPLNTFLTGDTSTWPEVLEDLGADVPVTHLVLNVGMLFVTWSEAGYMDRVTDALRLVTSMLHTSNSSVPLRIIWPSTPSVSPGVNCFQAYKRVTLKDHGILAQRVLKDFKEAKPKFRVDFVDYFSLTDTRPETSTDGRHWPMESDFETVTNLMRPLVKSADDAMLEWAWDVWRVRDQEEREV
ncbi:BZ3500_MvSof-1268-A1-R1_Chr1-3g01761 [Microbotryum saponariae]|uniref:BZ3500_MvSof-1268-A1-R1_Chr1-3g01761 protein n=1 Tax=Microbotryum saponariae TaxID=289078 RepID=A0A2X0LEY0_9BASI|nr:BZ3500_MvSof-1268-A1-R1_Chr1-3g01761 [Microbotryum saponariae]SCZ94543.1 BZ3501_MvSof-1269-A2-R1_Chr1-3g01363 [Microbotryum saponariae]